MTGFLSAATVLVAAVLIYLASLKGGYQVRRGLLIQADPRTVKQSNDLRTSLYLPLK